MHTNFINWWKIFVFSLFSLGFIYEVFYRIRKRYDKKQEYVYFGKNVIKDAFKYMPKVANNLKQFRKKNELLRQTRMTPIIGWTMIPDMNNGVVWIDKNGFRNDTLDLHDKTVVAIFGGSVGMGSFASDNRYTITGRLQYYLRKEYGNNIVVLNMAQSSFTMIQEVSLFCLLVDKLNIRVSIFIDGNNDINSLFVNRPKFFGFLGPAFGGWDKSAKGIIKVDTFFKTFLRFICQFSYLAKDVKIFLAFLIKKISKTAKAKWTYLGTDRHDSKKDMDKDLIELIKSFVGIAEIIRNRLKGPGRHALLTLQPTLYDYKHLSNAEKKFLQGFSQERILYWRKCYRHLKEKLYKRWHSYYMSNRTEDNIILADFTRILDEIDQTVFVDDCHIADFGDDLYARSIFNIIKHQGWLEKKVS